MTPAHKTAAGLPADASETARDPAHGSRLLIVSNRLPVTIRLREGQLQLVQSSGGLATGLRGCHERFGGLWLGWPGEISRLTASQRADLERLLAERQIVPIHLTEREVSHFYEGFSNGVIWPLFHYLLEQIPLDSRDWEAYSRVNEKFADAVARVHQPGDMLWVHDYQLLLVPRLLRERLPGVRMGFFLHIPFPSFEVFRTLPWRREVLEGLLGADVVAFHTRSYVRYFAHALARLFGIEESENCVEYQGRHVRLLALPLGIDVDRFQRLSEDDAVRREAESIRQEAGGRRLILGVDRLDYTKGIPRRLLALQRLLERDAVWRDRVRLIQVVVPSRIGVEPYRLFRKQLDELVGRINGAFGTVSSVPIHYLYRSIPAQRLVALYRAADVMLVTALRDGMNLVAKEFVASRVDEDGVLVLSEFAGAAEELHEAVVVNPYDIEGMATALERALTMDRSERATRMRALRQRVTGSDVHQWTDRFMQELQRPDGRPEAGGDTPSPAIDTLLSRLAAAEHVVLLLDYDGTLVPIVERPELARPDAAVLELLAELTSVPSLRVHLVSGRDQNTLAEWFADVPAVLWAEHGLWCRPDGGAKWEQRLDVRMEWLREVRPVLEQFTGRTPGSLIEEKRGSIAWHYRLADPEFGAQQARRLRQQLGAVLAGQPAELLDGSKVVEIRPHGVNKGVVVESVLAMEPQPATLVAVGDDRTDEDMFAALPPNAVAIHVGPGVSRADIRLPDHGAVRSFLRGLIQGIRGTAPRR